MEPEIIIIGIICVAICAMPFILSNNSRKKRERLMLESIKQLAIKHNCKITQHEFCGRYTIGIDEVNNFLFFHWNNPQETKQQVVDLSSIVSCNFKKTISSHQTIERLELELTARDKTSPNTVLMFYDTNLGYLPSGELNSVEKWKKLICLRLAQTK